MPLTQASTFVADYYLPLEDAIEELTRRRESKEFVQHIENSIKSVPEFGILFEKPRLIIFRQVATPSNEILRIINCAKNNNIEVLFIEYLHDKFTPSLNRYKYNLGKLPIYNGADVNENDIIFKVNIVDFAKMEGKPLNKVITHKQELIPDIHHYLLRKTLNVEDSMILDSSSFFLKFSSPLEYYKEFFKYFICHNILAEVYLKSGNELEFTNSNIIPAINTIEADYGIKPIIWNYLSDNINNDAFWDSYPKQVGDLLKEKGYY